MRFAKIWIIFIFLTAILMGCCTQPNNAHPTVPEIAKIANGDTVALIADFNHKPFCTGVWVSSTTILTANHCIEGYAKMLHTMAAIKALEEDGCPDELAHMLANLDLEVLQRAAEDDPLAQHILDIVLSIPQVNPDNLVIPYTVEREVVNIGESPKKLYHSVSAIRTPDEDLALLRIDLAEDIRSHGIAELADKIPEVGESVYITGQVLGDFWSFKGGLVSAYRHDMDEEGITAKGPFMQTSVIMGPGDSGGGVFNSDGKLIGIASFIEPAAHFSFCVHLETIRGFLQGQRLAPVHIDPAAPDPDLSN